MLRFSLCFLFLASPLFADGPLDNIADKVRRIPPPGKPIKEADKKELQTGVQTLAKQIAKLRDQYQGKPLFTELIADVQIFHDAVKGALVYDEFFKDYDANGKHPEVTSARKLLQLGHERAVALAEGKTPWLTSPGLTVRGYVSKIDGSVQPYGLIIPTSYKPGHGDPYRLDFWFHGRGETLSELAFISDRLSNPGQFVPADAFVLHPYGRYCNANHFAGEVDTFEALEHCRRYFPIDENRLVVRGFSMGGAACWNFAVHHAWRWAAAAPGAGFSETPDFLRVFQNEKLEPTWWERKLFHLYDCTDWAVNLAHCPTVAYSGTNDKQKQAADIMAKALAEEGIDLVHILGPDTGHSYHPQAKLEISKRIDNIARKGRDPLPHRLHFTTWTLRYPRMHWVTVQGLDKHWERARVDADLVDAGTVRIKTSNVNALSLTMNPGYCPLDMTRPVKVQIDAQDVVVHAPRSDRSWNVNLRKKGKLWNTVVDFDDKECCKRPGLQGPIDDAFMDSFLFVRPTGPALNSAVGNWVTNEMTHAVEHWRRQFRGQVRIKDDSQVTEEDIAQHNLILWGDPSSNRVLAKIVHKLPIHWSNAGIKAGAASYKEDKHVPTLIQPNPLNMKKYVVLNSGFTFREYDYLNNARQIPKLPDWAIYDISVPPTSRHAAGIVAAGFFDEAWQFTNEK